MNKTGPNPLSFLSRKKLLPVFFAFSLVADFFNFLDKTVQLSRVPKKNMNVISNPKTSADHPDFHHAVPYFRGLTENLYSINTLVSWAQKAFRRSNLEHSVFVMGTLVRAGYTDKCFDMLATFATEDAGTGCSDALDLVLAQYAKFRKVLVFDASKTLTASVAGLG